MSSPADSTSSAPSLPLSELISIAQLKSVASTTPQPYRIHAQVDSVSERTSAKGTTYLEARLVDATGSLLWRLFDNNPCFQQTRDLTSGSGIELAAEWIDTGKFGIEPRSPALRVLAESETAALLGGDASTSARQQHDYDTVIGLLTSIRDPRLHRLCQLFILRFEDRFGRTAAARGNHHARRGGLVEHVAQMMRSADALCTAYPDLNRDLLLAGVLFHDCGKLWENSYPETGFSQPFNLTGEMLGHIPPGLEVVNKLWREVMDAEGSQNWLLLEPTSELVRLHLLHLIGSHHGTHEFGSPVLPKTPEAVALHHIDNIDAKLEMLRQAYQTSKEIGPGIFDRFRPWPTNIVAPLPHYIPKEEPLEEDDAAE